MTEVTQQAISVEATAAPVENTVAVETPVVAENATAQAPATSWLDSLSDENKTAKPLQNFKGVDDLAKSYLHATQMLGKKWEDWSKEDVNRYYSKMGRPESADKYVLPEELGEDKTMVADLGFKLGLSQDQMNDLVNDLVISNRNNMQKAVAEKQAQANAWVDEIKQEFGTAFNERLAIAKRAVNEFGGDGMKKLLNETGLGNHPEVVKFFSKVGEEFLKEGRVIKGDHAAVFGTTPGEARNEINTLRNDKEFIDAFSNMNHPRHREMVQKWEELHAKAYV